MAASPPIRQGHPSSLLRRGSRNGRRPGGLLSCLHVPWGLQSAHSPPRWMLYGAGRAWEEVQHSSAIKKQNNEAQLLVYLKYFLLISMVELDHQIISKLIG